MLVVFGVFVVVGVDSWCGCRLVDGGCCVLVSVGIVLVWWN